MDIEKLGDDQYRIHDGGANAVEIAHEQFEDLFYSADTNPTAYYRVLVDSVCRTADDRTAMTSMIQSAGDMEAVLKDLQSKVKAIGI